MGGIDEENRPLPSMYSVQYGLQLFVKKSGLIGAVLSQVFLEAKGQRRPVASVTPCLLQRDSLESAAFHAGEHGDALTGF